MKKHVQSLYLLNNNVSPSFIIQIKFWFTLLMAKLYINEKILNIDYKFNVFRKRRQMLIVGIFFQSLENLMHHSEENPNQIRLLAQTLTDGGVMDELINEELETFNSRWRELHEEV